MATGFLSFVAAYCSIVDRTSDAAQIGDVLLSAKAEMGFL